MLSSWIVSSSSRTEVTRTFYDAVVVSGLPITQTNLRKRVVNATYSDVYDSDPKVYDHATHYSYDVHGMVNTLLQDNPSLASLGQQYKTVEYEYDLVSENINAVYYQRGEADQYTHYYEYDADDKIIKAFTSRSAAVLKDQDVRYLYYNHGPMARTEIGDLQVQGMDYAYTIQGWFKGVNSDMVDPTKDMGRDGDYTLGSNINVNFARDVFGYSLGYFEGDYYSINGVSAGGNHFLAEVSSGSDLLNARNDLYNGNISHMVTSITQPGTTTVLPYGYAYQYDQLNRLLHMEGYNNLDFPSNSWKTGGYTGAYETSLTYDANGNILTLNRNGEAGNINMDNLSYQYDWVNNDPAQGLRSNKLYHVNDATISTYTSDIDDQGSFTPASSVNDINALNNYGYDELGNLIRDDAEGIASIEWTVYGKIKTITRSASSTASNLSFKYDAQGKRIEKRETPYGGGADKVTYYVYDAGGELMATYSRHLRDDDNDEQDGEEMFICNSHIIYGSDRIGVDGRQDTLVGKLIAPIPAGYHIRILGSKQYENSNHLGNVLVTISDIKIPHDYNANSVVDYYTADIISAQDYYPFGSIMPGRNWSNEEYRFGFNGFEKDDDISGAGNHISFNDYGLNTRLGRRFQIDPVDVVGISGYAIFKNNPIFYIDPSGESPISIFVKAVAKAGLKKAAKNFVKNQIKKRLAAYSSKAWGKQLFKDALDFVDAATTSSWYDWVIEVIPIVGDAYGASKLGKQGYKLWKGLEKFEKVAELGVQAAKHAWKKLGSNKKVVGKGKELLESYTKKFNDQGKHLNADDLGGAVKEKFGLSSNGQHLKEATEALGGMESKIKAFKDDIKGGKFEGDALKAAQGILNDVQKQYDNISNALKSADKQVSKLGKIE